MRTPSILRDPAAASLLMFAGLVVGGLVAIGLGWRVVSGTLVVGFQTPALVSGGLGGLALVLIGCGLAVTQSGRRLAAAERLETEAVLDEATALLEAYQRRSS